tara:strand:+ start:536 stop:1276 length:741 start_codon:yes stop_codon:yes gene_type:complete
MRGIIFKTVKEGFRRLHKAHKAEVRRNKRNKGATPVIPFSLKKADFKRKIRGTKFTGAAEFKAQPGLKRRIRVGIERAKREKKKFRTPIMYGKAYASDKKGKTMQIQPLTSAQRKQMKKEMAASADRNYKKVRLRKLGYNTGGMKTVKMVKNKLEKASAAHAGQAKALGKVIDKKKLLLGGLLTKGIKSAYKAYRKAGGRKTSDIMKQPVRGAGKRSDAKDDVKFGIRLHGKGRYLSQREINKLMK